MGATLVSAVGVDEFIDETRGLHLVELLDALAEALASEVIDLLLVQRVLIDELQDEFLLLVAAPPAIIATGRVPGGGMIALGGVPVNRTVVHAVVMRRDESGVEDLLVDVGLEQFVDAPCFLGDVIGGHQFGLHGDAELVTRVARKSQAFAVVGD